MCKCKCDLASIHQPFTHRFCCSIVFRPVAKAIRSKVRRRAYQKPGRHGVAAAASSTVTPMGLEETLVKKQQWTKCHRIIHLYSLIFFDHVFVPYCTKYYLLHSCTFFYDFSIYHLLFRSAEVHSLATGIGSKGGAYSGWIWLLQSWSLPICKCKELTCRYLFDFW